MKHWKWLMAPLCAVMLTACSSSNKQVEENAATAGTEKTTTQAGSVGAAADAKFVSYESALSKAKASNKLIFVDIYTDWCTWCKKLDKDVYSDPAVQQAFAKNFALTKINAEADIKHTYKGGTASEQEIASRWNVSAYPTLVFLDQTEQPVFAYEGYLQAKDFVKLLTYVSSGDYKTNGGDFRAWLSTHAG